MIELKELSVGYPNSEHTVLHNLNIKAPVGLVCLLGRNGTGKSTLLRTLAGLQKPLEGETIILGKNVHKISALERARQISVVLTERHFGLGLTVEDAVSMGRQPHTGWRGQLSAQDWQIVQDALTLTQSDKFSGRHLDDLSDGEKQRVMIARAITQRPKVMLLDEITAFLDLPGRVEMMTLMRRHAHDSMSLILLSSHDLDLSLQLADQIWLLDGHGKMAIGSPQQLIDQGAIGRAFDTEEVVFSTGKARFELHESLSFL